ncbi:MAG: ATP-dependent DNA helicase RecG [Candidatus Moranbacteria bacterium]|nr:ATP-dependent DNA helicase RecG [Candidatus Moranbacteria bacterium]
MKKDGLFHASTMLTFDTPLSSIGSIKKPTLSKLAHLDIFSVHDLLHHFPHRYEDYADLSPISDLVPDGKYTVEGKITSLQAGRTWKKKMFLTDITVSDGSGTLRALWFNQRFVAQTLREGMHVRLSGKVSRDKQGLSMTNPAYERAERDATHTGRLVPIYPETRGLTSRFFRWQLVNAFKNLKDFPDPIPEDILKRLHLPSLKAALYYIHFPESKKHELLARKRFAFEEMFFVQLKALQIRTLYEKSAATPIPFDEERIKSLVASLPFSLTDAQRKTSYEILRDLERPRSMNRLLNGDVGSGKTLVAALAAFSVAENGLQTAFLAPTEILARQHLESITRFFGKSGQSIALLTKSYRILDGRSVTRTTLLKALAAGIPKIVIGTHALLQDDVIFRDLALVVVDEQHRFGVAQRAKLQETSFDSHDGSPATIPHFLTMTATPIPRTLTLAFFGNLDVSIIDELPKNRKPIITSVALNDREKERVYQFIREEIKKGRQAFIIFPLIEESLALKEVKAAVVEHTRLAEHIFPDFRIGLVHGKMKSQEKEQAMEDFKNKKYDILVATAVVEVGVDVPNASCMIIEEAERFGLAQLHQFRGRVGRGEYQSCCFLFPHQQSPSSESHEGQNRESSRENERLKVLATKHNGFEIAEADLAFRGPGAFLGTRQSGLPDIAMENLANLKLVEISRNEAKNILKSDSALKKHPLLLDALKRFEERIHLE